MRGHRYVLAGLWLLCGGAAAAGLDGEREHQLHQRLQQQALINDMIKWQQIQELERLRREREAMGLIDPQDYESLAEAEERERKLREDQEKKRREDMMKKERDKREERRKGMSGAFK